MGFDPVSMGASVLGGLGDDPVGAGLGLATSVFGAGEKAKAKKKARKAAKRAESQFMTSLEGPTEQLAKVQQDIEKRGTAAQQQAAAQTAQRLAAGGVRGGQAETLQSRQAGELGESLQQQTSEMALKEAQRKRDLQAQFLQQKAQQARTAAG